MNIAIPRPPWTGLGRHIESAMRKALYEFNMVDGVDKVAVALSGGKDSLTLLAMLAAVRGRGFPDFELYAINVSGEFSCGAGIPMQFLERFCAGLDVPLIVRSSNKTLDNLECYSCSQERRRLLFDAAKSVGCRTIAFGHHRDDHIQTLLMNLLHKAEFEGNLPKLTMHHFDVDIIRPLFFVTEDEIKTFAKQEGFLRVMCRCPVGQNSKRKQAEDLIHELEAVFPNARSNLAQAAMEYGTGKAGQA